MNRYCPENGKECFRSRKAAQKAADNMHNRFRGTASVYRCQFCHCWHLTHYSYEHSKAIRELNKQGYYGNPETKKRKKMHIYLDTDTEGTMLKVDIPNPAEGTQLMLSVVNADSPQSILLDYDQAQELVEAVKILLPKMQKDK